MKMDMICIFIFIINRSLCVKVILYLKMKLLHIRYSQKVLNGLAERLLNHIRKIISVSVFFVPVTNIYLGPD